MFGRKLACSFCGKSEAEVAKLVAGPRRVFICDRCVAAARRLMEDDDDAGRVIPASSMTPAPASRH
jgi:ATP-dependent Clp protease ATP-binding subunit ClpX